MTGYLEQYLLKFGDSPIPGTDKTDKTPRATPTKIQRNLPPLTDKTDKTPSELGSVSFVSSSHKESVNFSTAWPPRPRELAKWPIERRQRWGELANKLEDKGVEWPESERRAFEQVKAEQA
jgi:hypothetical protein